MQLALNQLDLPIRLRTARPLDDMELQRFCSDNDPLQIERDSNGELIIMSPTHTEGGSTEINVAAALLQWARQDGRGKVFGPSAGFTLDDTSMRAPDASWVSFPRWLALTEHQRKHTFATVCPEFVIEIRSDKDRLPDLRKKLEIWIANGAELAWLIDPERRSVEIYRPGESPDLLHDPTSVQGTGPVAGFELIMSNVWED